MKLLNSMFCIESRSDLTFEISSNGSHAIYQAHFPGRPITPGVCIMMLIEELVEVSVGCGLELAVVKNLKFLRPLTPSDHECMTVRFDLLHEDEGAVQVRGTIQSAEQVCTKFSMTFRKQ